MFVIGKIVERKFDLNRKYLFSFIELEHLQQHEQFSIMSVRHMLNIYRIMYVYGMDAID